MIYFDSFVNARKRSLGQDNMSTGICQSTGGGTLPPGSDTPQSRHPPPGIRYTSPGPGTPPATEHAGRYVQRAGGPHPTGMQSCIEEYE